MSATHSPKPTFWPPSNAITWLAAIASIAVTAFLLGRLTAGESPLVTGILESVTNESSPGTFATQSGAMPNAVPSRVFASALVAGNGHQIIPLQHIYSIELRNK